MLNGGSRIKGRETHVPKACKGSEPIKCSYVHILEDIYISCTSCGDLIPLYLRIIYRIISFFHQKRLAIGQMKEVIQMLKSGKSSFSVLALDVGIGDTTVRNIKRNEQNWTKMRPPLVSLLV